MEHVSLSMTEVQHASLHAHLFPGDGLEAVALLLCGRRRGTRERTGVLEITMVPYARCERAADHVTWRTDVLLPLLERAERGNFAIFKIHGHATLRQFSRVDDDADRALFPSLHGWLDDALVGSLVMMEDGKLFGRTCAADTTFEPLARVSVVGDDITFYDADAATDEVPEFGRRIAQSFGRGTFETLRRLKVGVVGCSGTGSPVVEMLARNCVGTLVLVDPDYVEDRNLNRILNTTREDALLGHSKVAVLDRAIAAMGLGTHVETFAQSLFDREVVAALADCDVLFGCMDSVDGRHLLNRLATFYLIPYFDLGVKLEADGTGNVDQVCGSVHYLKPGGSSLLSRHVYTPEQLRSAGLKRTDPGSYKELLEQGYIRGVAEDRPAVIQLNMLIASFAVNELLARLHPYRLDANGAFAVRRISLSHGIFETDEDGEPCPALTRHLGRGDVEPFLEWPELSLRGATQ